MKKNTLLFTFILLALTASAQSSDVLRQWKQGPLTYGDFRIIDTVALEHSFLDVSITISTQIVKYGKLYTGFPIAIAYCDTKESWMSSKHREPWELRYNQVIFDMTEVYRRYLQAHLDSIDYYDESSLVNKYMSALVDDINYFAEKSVNGADTGAILYFESIVWNLLDSLPFESRKLCDDNYLINYKPTPFSIGARIGGMGHFHFGELGEYFQGGGGLSVALRLGWYRHMLDLDASLGRSKCLQYAENTRSSKDDLYPDDPLSHPNFNISYGFNIVDKLIFRVTPFVGFSIQGYRFVDVDDTQYGAGTVAPQFGLDLFYFFSAKLFDSSISQLGLHGRLVASYDQYRAFVGNPGGWSIGFQIGIAGFGNPVYLRNND